MFFLYKKYSNSKFATVLSFFGGASYAIAALLVIYAFTGDIEFEIGLVIGIIACVLVGLFLNFIAKTISNNKEKKLLAKQNMIPHQSEETKSVPSVQPVQLVEPVQPVSFDIHTGEPIYNNDSEEEKKEESKEMTPEEKEKELERIEEELGKTIVFVSFPTEEEKKEQKKKAK